MAFTEINPLMETSMTKVRPEEKSNVKMRGNVSLKEEKHKEPRQIFLPEVRGNFYVANFLGLKESILGPK